MTEYDFKTQNDIFTALGSILADIKTNLNALRVDFLHHDHGDTGSYAQAGITFRAAQNTITASSNQTNAVVGSALPSTPLIGDNFLM